MKNLYFIKKEKHNQITKNEISILLQLLQFESLSKYANSKDISFISITSNNFTVYGFITKKLLETSNCSVDLLKSSIKNFLNSKIQKTKIEHIHICNDIFANILQAENHHKGVIINMNVKNNTQNQQHMWL